MTYQKSNTVLAQTFHLHGKKFIFENSQYFRQCDIFGFSFYSQELSRECMFVDGYVKEMSSPYNLQVYYDRLDDIFKPHFKIELMALMVVLEPSYVLGLNNIY